MIKRLHISLIGLIILLLTGCNARMEKELVYYRDQNNRLYAISEVRHIQHEQAMDLMPKSKLVFGGKMNIIEFDERDSVEVYEAYKKKADISFKVFKASFVSSIVGIIGLFSYGYLGLFSWSINLFSGMSATDPHNWNESLLFIFTYSSILLYIALFIIGLHLFANLQQFKKDYHINTKERKWHKLFAKFVLLIPFVILLAIALLFNI